MVSFNEEGFPIPAGETALSKEDFESFFCSLNRQDHRRALVDSWNQWMKDLTNIVAPDSWVQWIAGSFTTTKEVPGDIDVVSLMDSVSVDELDLCPHPYRSREGNPNIDSRERYKVDSYIISVYPQGDPRYKLITLPDIAYWKDWWGHTEDKHIPRAFFTMTIK